MQHTTPSSFQLLINNDREVQNNVRRLLRRHERLLAFEQAMFNWRSRHLLLMLTLCYKPEWRSVMQLGDIARHRDQLLNNMRSNPILQNIEGYVWIIEEGGGVGGLHIHLVVFYSGECRKDIFYAQAIGEYWSNEITSGRGAYWNSNADKEKFRRGTWGDATGQIDRGDAKKRGALRKYLVGYLCKNEQQVSRFAPHIRTFGMSAIPG